MSENAHDKLEPGPPDSAEGPAFGNWTHFLLILCSFGAVLQCMSIGINAFRPIFAIEDQRGPILLAGLATGLAGGFALYFFAMHLLGKPKSQRLFRISAAVLLVFSAFQSGAITTLFVFVASSPWGYVVEGITGPLFGWLEGVIPVVWWPVFFIAGFAIATGVILRLWEVAKAKGFVTPDGVRT